RDRRLEAFHPGDPVGPLPVVLLDASIAPLPRPQRLPVFGPRIAEPREDKNLPSSPHRKLGIPKQKPAATPKMGDVLHFPSGQYVISSTTIVVASLEGGWQVPGRPIQRVLERSGGGGRSRS